MKQSVQTVIKVLLLDLLIAIALVVLYSPGLLALCPTDESIFKAGSSIVAGIVLLYVFLRFNLMAFSQSKVKGANFGTLKECREALLIFEGRGVFSQSVKDALNQLDRLSRYDESYPGILSGKFPEGSLSYQKFDGMVKESEEVLTRNYSSMVSRIQLFDEKGYQQLKKLIVSGQYRSDTIPDSLQEEKLKTYEKGIQSVKDILSFNERIILRLETLISEVASLNQKEIEEKNDRILEEVSKLVSEVKYYAD